MAVDCHAHVYSAACALAPDRFYTPDGEHPVEEFITLLDAHGLTHGIIVQPSFLGTDNSYLLACLSRHADRLRGIALVAPGTGERELDRLRAGGVVGVRINLSVPRPSWTIGPALQALSSRLGERGMQLELQAKGDALVELLGAVLPAGVRIVVDHFGAPAAPGDRGFRALLGSAGSGRVWVKFTAPYRVEIADLRPYSSALLSAFGTHRILWGSDWPWTRHSAGMRYGESLGRLEDWIPDPRARDAVLGASAAELFGFPIHGVARRPDYELERRPQP